MEEQSKKQDQILKKLIVEAGSESPSPDFKSKLMEAIQQSAEQKVVYKPLISTKIWIGVLIAFAAIVAIAVLFPSTGLFSSLGIEKPIIETGFSLPKPEFSKTFVYGVMFLSLFILQIPFLKKYVEAKYSVD